MRSILINHNEHNGIAWSKGVALPGSYSLQKHHEHQHASNLLLGHAMLSPVLISDFPQAQLLCQQMANGVCRAAHADCSGHVLHGRSRHQPNGRCKTCILMYGLTSALHYAVQKCGCQQAH